ncbi:MAG: dTDP-4-dehydrorhamnose reductase [Proteobacteria bacterium]|nr:dTDP-4-dehydrorhamnose reductase [Pseudomonadota bacterium]
MLGRALFDAVINQHEVVALPREVLDVRDADAVRDCLAEARCEVVVNCAAFTDVDGCESRVEEAMAINGEGPRNLAAACARQGAALVHISTDYVFAGDAGRSYEEDDLPRPCNAYGRSKLAGEQAVRATLDRHCIVRTSGLFGLHGPSFVRAILAAAQTRDTLRVVRDQVSVPTYVRDLADALRLLVERESRGTWHVTATSEGVPWSDFARQLLEAAGRTQVQVIDVTTAELGRPAPRPAFSVLAPRAWERAGLAPLPPPLDGLRRFLREWEASAR